MNLRCWKGLPFALSALGVALSTAPASAQSARPPSPTVVVNTAAEPVPVTVVQQASSPFSIPPVQVSLAWQGGFVPIDPSGTRYAISSVTVTNATGSPSTVSFYAVAFSVLGENCRLPSNMTESSDGPIVVAAPYSTTHLVFPEPYVTAAVSGTGVCLVAGGSPALEHVKWSAVGHRILP